jgi:hypothetical protein
MIAQKEPGMRDSEKWTSWWTKAHGCLDVGVVWGAGSALLCEGQRRIWKVLETSCRQQPFPESQDGGATGRTDSPVVKSGNQPREHGIPTKLDNWSQDQLPGGVTCIFEEGLHPFEVFHFLWTSALLLHPWNYIASPAWSRSFLCVTLHGKTNNQEIKKIMTMARGEMQTLNILLLIFVCIICK